MMHRKATVVMIGACMLWLTMASAAMATEFYAEGTADAIEGADNLGKTIVHYIVVLGFPVLSAGLMTGGLVKMRRDPGSGGGLLASGIGAGYLSTIVNNLHTDAGAAVVLVPVVGGASWLSLAVGLGLQAACLASAALYARRRTRCGNAAAASSMSP